MRIGQERRNLSLKAGKMFTK